MKKYVFFYIFIFLFFFTIGCGEKKPEEISQAQSTPNIQNFVLPFSQVWKTVLETVEYEFLLSIEIRDEKKGFFSSEVIRDDLSNQKKRFRLSATFISNGNETIVKLYKHEEILEDKIWKAIPSNLQLENQILTRASQRLNSVDTSPIQNSQM